MKRKELTYEGVDFSKVEENFYNIDKPFFLANKPVSQRLSSGFIDYDSLKDDKQFYEKAVRFITRNAYSLFSFITEEQFPAISLDLKKSGAYCSLTENKIVVGLKMLTYKKIPAQLKVDTIISTLYHEMYHKRFTITGIKEELKFEPYHKYYGSEDVKAYVEKMNFDKTIASVINILEDKRIEAMGAEDFPGYAFYFEESRKYCYFLHSTKKTLPPYEVLILDYLMMKILLPELTSDFLLKYDEGFEILTRFKDKGDMPEEDYKKNKESFEKVKEVFRQIDSYIAKNNSKVYSYIFKDILEASNEIYELIPKEMVGKINEAIEKSEIKGFIKLTECAGGKAFASEEGEILSEDMIAELNEAISDELEKLEKEAEEQRKNQERKVHIDKIKRNSACTSYTEYEVIEEPPAAIDTLLYADAKRISKNICNNLGFLDSRFARNIENYELSEGELDEDEIYSISFKNKFIFEDVEEIPSYSLDFGILLDESGSMSGRIREAKLATLSMILGLKDNKHINLFVYGHTANNGSNSKAIQIYKYFNTLHRCTDYRKIFNAQARSNNADGFAIEKLADIMKESKSRDKILVVVSDGQPSAYGYGGTEGEQHVKQVVDGLEAQGITVIQVCMAYIENSPRMFKHYVPYEKSGLFFDQLKKILTTKLHQFADSI